VSCYLGLTTVTNLSDVTANCYTMLSGRNLESCYEAGVLSTGAKPTGLSVAYPCPPVVPHRNTWWDPGHRPASRRCPQTLASVADDGVFRSRYHLETHLSLWWRCYHLLPHQLPLLRPL